MRNYRAIFILAIVAGTGFAYGLYTTGSNLNKIQASAPSEKAGEQGAGSKGEKPPIKGGASTKGEKGELCTYQNGEYETLELKMTITDARSILGNISEESSTERIKIFVWDNGPGCRKIMLEFRDGRLIGKKRLPLPKNS